MSKLECSTLIFLGLPHSGKSSTAMSLSKDSNIEHINVGEMLRSVIKEQNELSSYKEILQVVSDGENVSDDIVGEIVEENMIEMNDKNVILDGFPREVNSIPTFYSVMNRCQRNFEKILICHFTIPEEQSIKLNRERKRDIGLKPWSIDNRYKNFKDKEIPLINLFKSTHNYVELSFESGMSENIQKIRKMIDAC